MASTATAPRTSHAACRLTMARGSIVMRQGSAPTATLHAAFRAGPGGSAGGWGGSLGGLDWLRLDTRGELSQVRRFDRPAFGTLG